MRSKVLSSLLQASRERSAGHIWSERMFCALYLPFLSGSSFVFAPWSGKYELILVSRLRNRTGSTMLPKSLPSRLIGLTVIILMWDPLFGNDYRSLTDPFQLFADPFDLDVDLNGMWGTWSSWLLLWPAGSGPLRDSAFITSSHHNTHGEVYGFAQVSMPTTDQTPGIPIPSVWWVRSTTSALLRRQSRSSVLSSAGIHISSSLFIEFSGSKQFSSDGLIQLHTDQQGIQLTGNSAQNVTTEVLA